jgi:predicted nucleic acid-binding protein
MIYVFDSTPLIYLSKASLSWIFEELRGEKLIPEGVYQQVVTRGEEIGEADALIVEELIEKGTFSVNKVEIRKTFQKIKEELHEGEIEVLQLAKEKEGIAIIDEGIAREIGEIFNIHCHGSFYLIFLMVKKGKLSRKEAKGKVDEMIKKGWRLRHEQYLEFLELLKL